jgi:hypothetical protein
MLSVADFSVILTGASSTTRHAAALLIDQALRARGFNGIDIVDDHGEEMKLPECATSLLEVIKQSSPTFFDAHVVIQEVKVRTYDDFYDEVKPMHRSTLN